MEKYQGVIAGLIGAVVIGLMAWMLTNQVSYSNQVAVIETTMNLHMEYVKLELKEIKTSIKEIKTKP